jgi:hypothetical protein
MVGTSRCIAATLFKFGGPTTLPQATPSPCVRTSDSVLLTRERSCVTAEIFSALESICSLERTLFGFKRNKIFRPSVWDEGLWAHVQGREVAATFLAAA